MNAQNLDSLWMEFDSTDDIETQIKTGLRLAEELRGDNPDTAFFILERIGSLAEENELVLSQVKVMNQKGMIYKILSDYTSELEIYLEAKRILEEQPEYELDTILALEYINVLTGISVNYMNTGKFEETIELLTTALEFLGRLEIDPNSTVVKKHYFILNLNIGSAYLNQYAYDDASYYYSLAMNFLDKDDKINYSVILNNLGIIAKDKGDYIKAEEYLNKSLEIRREENNMAYVAQTLNNLGSMWVIREEPEKALPYFLEILELSEDHIIPLSSFNIAHIYLHSVYSMLGDYETAYNYAIDQIILNDSLTKARNIQAIARMEMKADFERSMREAKIRQQELELRRQRNESFYILSIVVSILGLLVFVLFYFLQRGKLRRHKIENERNLLKRKNLEFDKEKLELDLEFKNKELATNVMYLARTNEFINSISEKLLLGKHTLTRENQLMIDRIISELQNYTDQDVWQEFEVRFQQVHSDFYVKLNDQFPDLTANEKKLSAFLRLNMTTKEISALTYQTPNSITVARSRLRKKLGVDHDENLISFLENL